MSFAGINYIAVLIAGAAGWIAGAVWYMAFATPWMAAAGTTREAIEASKTARRLGAVRPGVRGLRGHGLGAGRHDRPSWPSDAA